MSRAKILDPLEAHGLKTMSLGYLVDPDSPMIWRGAMATSAVRQMIDEVAWGDLDVLLLDLPPGTGDVHLTIAQTIPVTGAVIVSTPQAVAAADARKAVMMFKQEHIKIPILGVIENMAYFTPAELPENKYYIFGKGGAVKMAEQFDLPFLGELPLVQSIREGGDMGIPAVIDEDSPARENFLSLARNVAQNVSIRNANLEPTKVLEINN
jgi:ATP-binding protein involved in chromosome partitioning